MFSLTLKNVTKRYGRFRAVDDVSLGIHEGEAVGLVGESGCGKSTVASILAGLIRADSGEFCFNGEAVANPGPDHSLYRRNVQMVFQDSASALNSRLSARECVMEPLENFWGLKGENAKHRANELLRQVGLDGSDGDKYPRQFSGGQKQRICIARAIAADPRFLILDEFTSNLDVSVQAQMLNLLNDLKKLRNVGFLLISHDFGIVRYMCDRVYVMSQGSIVEVLSEEGLRKIVHLQAFNNFSLA
ncbi:MAG: dipeptide/oligopeptide/nickel ABC transporter ATP-binding protein [Synergistaceae bacterium]|nr:dipeptide/oligopeptide/nickel ABC transporter ATP-binding protein [Synergistaceae bacterium]